jgi:transcriptional regulator with XRE-family HTH domain
MAVGGPTERQVGLARAVRHLREADKVSADELAARAELSASCLSKIESGLHDPSWANIRRVARGLGVSITQLAIEAERHEPDSSVSRSLTGQ